MIVLYILITLGAFLLMEGVAWFTHKYIMHGLLWTLHRDHHRKDTDHFFERNDFFFLLFGIPGATASIIGALSGYNYVFFIGLGITLYGIAYFLIHDVFIHQRFHIFRHTDNAYFRAIRKAHKVHHKHLDREDGECFGMLWVPFRYFREAARA